MLQDYAIYNLWANRTLVEWLRTHPAELLEQATPSSFPSLKLTFLHIWSAEEIWMQRLQKMVPTAFRATTFVGTAQEVLDGLLENSAVFADFIQQQDAAFFHEICDFQLLNGMSHLRLRSAMVLHCIQHSTYHRGQVVTMARALGLTDPPSTDYMKYLSKTS